MGADKLVVFCATQRSGSAMVADDFFNLLGGPSINAEIIFTSIFRDKEFSRWTDVWWRSRQLNRIGDVVCVKVMAHYVPYISDFIGGVKQDGHTPITDFDPDQFRNFHRVFRDAIWVHLRREDPFAAAVSLHIAETTNRWERWRTQSRWPTQETGVAPFDSEKMLRKAMRMIAERKQWDDFFKYFDIDPVRISYEDAVADYPNYLDELILKVGAAPVTISPERRMLKVGTSMNVEWAQRLRQEWIEQSGTAA